MGKLTTDDVNYIAKLSDLKLNKQEVEKFKRELSKIIDYIDELSEVDTDSVEPTAQTTGLYSVFRDDVLVKEQTLDSKCATSQAKKSLDKYFVVPLVLEEKTI